MVGLRPLYVAASLAKCLIGGSDIAFTYLIFVFNNRQIKTMGITRKELKVYEVIKPLSGYFDRYKNKGVGHKFNSEILFERGYNINQLVEDGTIVEIPKIFPFEEKIVGRNQHSVYVRCKECLRFGINMPLETDCPNCGYSRTITYYDAETIQKYINSLTSEQ